MITPFIAQMQALADAPDGRSIDLFYSTSVPDEDFISRVKLRAEQAHVGLHIAVAARDSRGSRLAFRQRLVLWAGRLRPGAAPGIYRQRTVARGLSSGTVRYEVSLILIWQSGNAGNCQPVCRCVLFKIL